MDQENNGDGDAVESVSKADHDAAVAKLQGELDAANAVATQTAAQRDQHMMQVAAYKTVLGKHNIAHELDASKMAALSVNGGVVRGEYAYVPPVPTTAKPATPQVAPVGNGATSLTREMLGEMSADQINARWNEVKEVLAAPVAA